MRRGSVVEYLVAEVLEQQVLFLLNIGHSYLEISHPYLTNQVWFVPLAVTIASRLLSPQRLLLPFHNRSSTSQLVRHYIPFDALLFGNQANSHATGHRQLVHYHTAFECTALILSLLSPPDNLRIWQPSRRYICLLLAPQPPLQKGSSPERNCTRKAAYC